MKTLMQILPSLDLTGGGVERGTLDIAKEAATNEFRSVIVSSGGDMAEKYKHKGVKHYNLPVKDKGVFNFFRLKILFKRLLEKVNPDIVHIRSRWPAFCLNNLVKNKGIPLITTYHGTYSGNNNPIKKKYNKVMTESDKIISISDFISDHIITNFPECKSKITQINRGIDTNYFHINSVTQFRKEKALLELGIDEGKHIILLPGRLTAWKGHEVAIKAAEILTTKYPQLNYAMIFVGSEQNRKKYKEFLDKRIKKLNLVSKVLLVGTKLDMPAVYSLSDIIISTSILPEAFGRVSAEASSLSKPIIASNHGGSKNIIEDKKTGWLIEPNNPLALANTIANIMNKSQKEKDQIGKRARDKIVKNFSLNQMFDKTLTLYNETIEEKKNINY